MRVLMIGLALLFGTLVGCGQDAPKADNQGGGAITCTVAPGLTVELPKGWKVREEAGFTEIKATVDHPHMQLWTVADAAAPAGVLPKIAEMVKSKVLDFKAVETKDITLAGAPAKHIIGTGVEADDNDAAKVEVFIFSAGKKVYLLCAHTGEEDPAQLRTEILALLNTAKAK